jgi:Raf kinase inhibitor-like YbhB/YbcL family protein
MRTTALFAILALSSAASAAGALSVRSQAFTQSGPIPAEYSCEGRGTSPPITWSNVPPETRSIAVIVDDPDAPRGTFVHLAVYNLPPSTDRLPPDLGGHAALPSGWRVALNSKGEPGYSPLCPPTGQHKYRFRVMALDGTLSLPATASAAELEHAMSGHVIASGELDGVFAKSQR